MHTFAHLGHVLPNGMKQGGVKLKNTLERFVLIKFTTNQMFWSEIKSRCQTEPHIPVFIQNCSLEEDLFLPQVHFGFHVVHRRYREAHHSLSS